MLADEESLSRLERWPTTWIGFVGLMKAMPRWVPMQLVASINSVVVLIAMRTMHVFASGRT